MVREAAEKAVKEQEQQEAFYRFRLRRETKTYKLDRDLVETKDGFVARTLLWQEQELTAQERADDDAKLDRLVMDEDERKRTFSRQKSDEDRILKLVKALPDGLLYEYDGVETINHVDTFRLKFKPNPKFSTTSRETIVYRSAEGFLWVDTVSHNIVRLEGLLTNNINIGWGLLGHIDKGGKVELEQAEVSPGHWRITKLITEATGTALLFKSIAIWQHQYASDFTLLPIVPTVEKAVQILREPPPAAPPVKNHKP